MDLDHPAPAPQAICLEDLDALSEGQRYLCCVALPGRQPGLGLDDQGEVRWEGDRPLACELWVTADSRLALFRRRGGAEVVVSRAGRSLEAPPEQPVILLHEDLVEVGGRRLRVHLHGVCETASPPRFYGAQEGGLGNLVRVAAAALAIGTASLAGVAGCQGDGNAKADAPAQGRIEVRTKPPDVSPPVRPRPKPDAGVKPPGMKNEPIEVRLKPPEAPAQPIPRDAGVPKPPKPPMK